MSEVFLPCNAMGLKYFSLYCVSSPGRISASEIVVGFCNAPEKTAVLDSPKAATLAPTGASGWKIQELKHNRLLWWQIYTFALYCCFCFSKTNKHFIAKTVPHVDQ